MDEDILFLYFICDKINNSYICYAVFLLCTIIHEIGME